MHDDGMAIKILSIFKINRTMDLIFSADGYITTRLRKWKHTIAFYY